MCTKMMKMEEYIMELKKSLDEKAMIKMDIVKEEKAIGLGLSLACDGVGPCQRNPQPACVDVGTQFDGLVTVEVSVQTVDVVVAGVDCGVQVGSDVKLVSASVQTDVSVCVAASVHTDACDVGTQDKQVALLADKKDGETKSDYWPGNGFFDDDLCARASVDDYFFEVAWHYAEKEDPDFVRLFSKKRKASISLKKFNGIGGTRARNARVM